MLVCGAEIWDWAASQGVEKINPGNHGGTVDTPDRTDQPLCVRVQRTGEQSFDRRFLDHAAGIHHDDPLRGLGDHAHRMGDQHDRHAETRLHFGQQIEDLRLDGDIERRGGLVRDENSRA
jgi:hypothetical protein